MKKSKLITTLCTLVLTLACLTFGVYSAVKTSFTASGTITFNSYGLDVLVEGTITNAVAANNGTLNSKYYGASKSDHSDSNYTGKVGTDGSLPQWNMGAIGFNELDTTQTDEAARNTITIELKVKNYSGYPISATPTLAFGTNGSETVDAFSSAFDYTTTNGAKSIADTDGAEGVLTITITPKSFTTSIDGSFKMSVDIKPYSETEVLKWDETGYWYLEMGNLDNSAKTPLKWRLISTDDSSAYVATSQSAKPTKLSGIYVLETYGGGLHVLFGGYETTTGYVASDLRAYLNGSGSYTYDGDNYTDVTADEAKTNNFMTQLNISTENEIFQKIQKVGFSDKGNSRSTTVEATDTFWALSKEEATNYLCGGTWDNAKAKWGGEYWLRTQDETSGAWQVDSAGNASYNETLDNGMIARPAFKIA